MARPSEQIGVAIGVLDAFIKYVCREENAGDGVTFSVVIDDPDSETYAVRARAFHDADRAGFSDYINKEIMTGLSQVEASAIVKLLTDERQRQKEERDAYFAQ